MSNLVQPLQDMMAGAVSSLSMPNCMHSVSATQRPSHTGNPAAHAACAFYVTHHAGFHVTVTPHFTFRISICGLQEDAVAGLEGNLPSMLADMAASSRVAFHSVGCGEGAAGVESAVELLQGRTSGEGPLMLVVCHQGAGEQHGSEEGLAAEMAALQQLQRGAEAGGKAHLTLYAAQPPAALAQQRRRLQQEAGSSSLGAYTTCDELCQVRAWECRAGAPRAVHVLSCVSRGGEMCAARALCRQACTGRAPRRHALTATVPGLTPLPVLRRHKSSSCRAS